MAAVQVASDVSALKTRPRKAHPVGLSLSYLAAVFVVGITLVPMLYVVISGFRTTAQINTSPVGLPHPWVFSNYSSILSSSSFWHFVGNSVIIAAVATGAAVAFGSMAAFALSRYAFRGREALFGLFMVGLLFPASVASLPLYLLLRQIGLLENLMGVAIPEAAFSSTDNHLHIATVPARRTRRTRGRRRGRRRQPLDLLPQDPAAVVEAGRHHRGHPGFYNQLERVSPAAPRLQPAAALHSAAGRRFVRIDLFFEHGRHSGFCRPLDGARAGLFRAGRAAHR